MDSNCGMSGITEKINEVKHVNLHTHAHEQCMEACTVIRERSMTGAQVGLRHSTPPLASFYLLILMRCQITIHQRELKTVLGRTQPTHHLEGGGDGVDYG